MRRREFVSAALGGVVCLPKIAVGQIRREPAPEQRPSRGWLYSTAAGEGGFREVEIGHWTEITPDGKLFSFAQVSENPTYVELVDASRGIWLRLRATYIEFRREPATGWNRLCDGGWAPWSRLPPLPDYQIRLVYFLPSDRNPTSNFEAKIRVVMQFVGDLYRQNLQGRGFKAKDLAFQTQDGKPIVHLVRGHQPAVYYSGAPNYDSKRQYQKLLEDIPLTVGSRSKDVMIVFAETFDSAPAPVEWLGAFALGTRFSTTGGVAIISAWILQDMFCATSIEKQRNLLFDDTPIQGRIAMGNGRPNSPRSQFIADGFGAVAHELGHVFGLVHDYRRPDIMANGFRRLRWNFTVPPQLAKGATFSAEATRFLLTSRYLGTDLDFLDNAPPKVTMRIIRARLDRSPASVTVSVEASDDRGLRAIVFYAHHQDSVVGGRALNGKIEAFTQELEIAAPKSNGVQIEAFVSDVGGNLSQAAATA